MTTTNEKKSVWVEIDATEITIYPKYGGKPIHIFRVEKAHLVSGETLVITYSNPGREEKTICEFYKKDYMGYSYEQRKSEQKRFKEMLNLSVGEEND